MIERTACQYAIVRFAPYVETGEFANVGILMMAPARRYFGFKLQTRRHGRITRFFDELDAKHYREALGSLKEELERVNELLKARGFDKRRKFNDTPFANRVFTEVIRPRESVVRFGEPRVVLAADPKKKLTELFAFYVERNFVTKEYRETVLERNVRRWLDQAQLGDKFRPMPIGDEEYQAKFPFVEMSGDVTRKAIKPLNLAQEKPSSIIEHGGKWWFRLDELQRRGRLPEKVMFAVEAPDSFEVHRHRAYEEIVGRLEAQGAEIAFYRDKEHVLRFALS